MNFLLIASFPDSILKFRGELLRSLANKGLTIHIAAPDLSANSSLCRAIEKAGYHAHDIPLRRVGMNPVADLNCLFSILRLVKVLRPAAVLAYTVKPVIYGLVAARMGGARKRFALITGLGYSFQSSGATSIARTSLRKLVEFLYRFALKGAEKVFFQNPDDRALFLQRDLVGAPEITVVVNGSGVDISQFSVTDFPSQTTFLLIARLLGEKGVREYVEAARVIKKRHPNTIFNVVGWIDANPDSIDLDELETWIAEGLINYLGRLDDVREAIKACSVYVLPSYREGTPRTVLEAMAMGRGIITTDAPGCKETVCDGVNGYLVPVRSVEGLVSAMERFIVMPELVSSMGTKSRDIAEDKYDVNKVNQFMLKEMGFD